ncbi:class I SAM-dependent methyltransferase [Nocardioides marmorisolisilvae]|uniref:SAM-dependent methyltransferase n=1 Tax=Nocardioides marmorisolisilvae TaxID=1542737 RepID=A0A3N0E0J0_9ACTN|nr:class I SAM-dependent methyltransferase [Nocardioides marmorisolisilvae]RNL81296.1 SAM-dependent methyltransferase [Nocardioides marmorisolisilvae]
MTGEDSIRTPERARSFAKVADAYDRARPGYPAEAAEWLVGSGRSRVLELGAGTGLLTERLVAAGHDVLATDPLPEMLAHLRRRLPDVPAAVGTAESIPAPSRSMDVVVSAESFHWFDHERALAEISRVLRPGGVLALVWNFRDESIPWVRKLGRIINPELDPPDLVDPLRTSEIFGFVESREFAFYQSLGRPELLDLVRSRSYIAAMEDPEREDVLGRVGALYDDYGRGPDGMQLRYLTRCYRSAVTNQPPAPVVVTPVRELTDGEPTQAVPGLPATGHTEAPRRESPPEDTGTLLIDFK